MKKLFLTAAVLAMLSPAARAESISIGGTTYEATRVVDRQVAPGVQYVYLSIPSRGTYGTHIFVTIADLTNPDVKIEYHTATGTVGGGTKTLASIAAANTSANHRVVAGANANFWVTSEQPWKSQIQYMPHGMAVSDGMLLTPPNQKTNAHVGGPTITGAIMVDKNGKVVIRRFNHQFDLYHARINHTMDLDDANRVVQAGTASIYTKAYGTDKAFKPVNTTSSNTWQIVEGVCTEVLMDLAPGESWHIGGDTKFVIKEVRQNAGTGTLGNHDIAVVGRDSYASVLAAHYLVGDEIVLKQRFLADDGTAPEVVQATSGNCVTLVNGVNETDQVTSQAGYNNTNYARTIYGTNDAGDKLIIAVCGNKTSTYYGMTTKQLTDVVKHFGATWASQVDCGGSAQMYVDGEQVNKSTDGSGIRAVHSGMFVVSTAAYDPSVLASDIYDDPAKEAGHSAPDAYEMKAEYVNEAIPALEGYTVKRVIAKGDRLYILGLNGTQAKVVVYNHLTKQVVSTPGTSVCAGDILPLSDIALTADGLLIGINKAKQGFNGSPMVNIYKWNNNANGVPDGEATVWGSLNNGGNYTNAEAGETMTYQGNSNEGLLYYTAQTTGASAAVRFVRVAVAGKAIGEAVHNNLNSVDGFSKTALGDMLLFASPYSRDNVVLNGTLKSGAEFATSATKATVPTLVSALPGGVAAEAAHTSMLRHGGKTYMVSPAATGVTLHDVSTSLAAGSAVTVTCADMAAHGTSACAAGAGRVANDKAQLALFSVSQAGVSKYATVIDEVKPDPEPDPVGETGTRSNFAYDLKMEKNEGVYDISYSLTDDVKDVKLILTPVAKDATQIIIENLGTAKGVNTTAINANEIEGGQYTWAIEVSSKAVAKSTKIHHVAPEQGGTRGGVVVINDPESAAFGKIITSNGYAKGFGVFYPDFEKQGYYSQEGTAGNRSSHYRAAVNPNNNHVYAIDYADAAAGIYDFDPANTDITATNVFSGTKDAGGCWTLDGVALGGGGPGIAFTGKGEDTRLWSFQEDYPTANAKPNVLVCYNIGTADKITSAPRVFTDLNSTRPFANLRVNIVPAKNGLFLSQIRGNGSNSEGAPGFIYIDFEGNRLYSSFSQADIIPACGSGMCLLNDETQLAVSLGKSGIRIYDVTWNNNVPTLSVNHDIENSANADDEVSQLATDPAGNLYAFFSNTSDTSLNGLNVFSVKNSNPVCTTPAPRAYVIEGTKSGVEDIVMPDDANVDGADAPAVYYNLNGVRLSGDNLQPGFYLKVKGRTVTKVLVR